MKAIIKLDESITEYLDGKGELMNSVTLGKLKILNPSNSTTLWSISLSGENEDDVNGFQTQEVSHVQAGKNFETFYQIQSRSKLSLIERIDTHFTQETSEELKVERNTLISGIEQEVLFEITLKNEYEFPLVDIELIKQFDPSCINYRILQPHPGSVDESASAFIWHISELETNASTLIRIVATFIPSSSHPVPTGEIIVRTGNDGQISSLRPTIDADCDNVDLTIEVDELDDPGNWKINTSYLNNSEFHTFLESVKVIHEDSPIFDEKVESHFSADPGGEAWQREGPSWKKVASIKTQEYPLIEKDFKYHVEYETIPSMKVALNKENDHFRVVEISVEKEFQPEKVNTYTRTPLVYNIEIKNIGTAEIGSITLDEILPSYLLVTGITSDSDADITASIDGKNDLDGKLVELIESQDDIPEDIDLGEKRKIQVVLSNLSFYPGSTIKLKYNCIAEKPKPNLDYSASSDITAYSVFPTHGFVTHSLTNGDEPGLKVAFAKRSFKTKASYQAISDNVYEIGILVVNNGDVPLENVRVGQQISTATYLGHEPSSIAHELKPEKLDFMIPEIQIGAEILINLRVNSDGPLRQQQPTLTIEKASGQTIQTLNKATSTVMGMYPELYSNDAAGKEKAEKHLQEFNPTGEFNPQTLRDFSLKYVPEKLNALPKEVRKIEYKTPRGISDDEIQRDLKIATLYNPSKEHTIFRPDGSIKLKEYDLLSIGSDYYSEHTKNAPPNLDLNQEIYWNQDALTIQGAMQHIFNEEAKDKPTHDVLIMRVYKRFIDEVWDIGQDDSMKQTLKQFINDLH